MALAAGTRLGPYEIRGLLGAGGMGEVYQARDPRLGREVAVKVLPPEVAADPDRLRRFEQEARAVAALNHPHIIAVYDVGRHEGIPYVVTELLEGETLQQLLARRSPTPRQALAFAVQVAQGLAAAHAKGILHRDVKPANVFVTTDGRVKLLDFGLAKLTVREATDTEGATESSPTRPGQLLGTVAYMSPEQARALPLDERSDLFSLGVLLYELLSGKHPFLRETAVGTLGAILEEAPAELASVSRAVPPALSGIVRRCLEKEREQRFRSAHDLALSLEAVLQAPTGAAALEEVEERSPYPGLSSFTERDASVFFGREGEVKALWQRLQGRKLLAVIGPSGAGKSSFLRAGVLPARPEGWTALVATPGARPAFGLAQALTPELAGDAEAMGELLGGVAELIESGEGERVVSAVRRWRSRHAEALLVVDQFEELFTLSAKGTQERFVALVGRLVSEADVHVVLSLRDDFLMRCHEQAALVPVFTELTPLGALTPEGLRRALVEPAKKRGYAFEDESLVDEMVESVEGVRGALPLLAFAVARLWEKRDRVKKLLTREAYEEIGGVAGALAQHAEATMDAIGPERHNVVREIFRNLATAQGTRAVMDREELLSAFPERAEAEAALRQLIESRLLTTYEVEGEEGEPSHHRVEVVHESLLKEGALLRDQLKQAAHLWGEKGRTSDLLWTGTAYREYTLWRERYPGALTALEEDFARAMAERAHRQRRRRQAIAGAVVAAALAVAAVTGVLWRRSEVSRREAKAEALRAEANALLALGRAELDRYPTAALAYARKSLEVADTAEGRRFAVDALWRSPTARILPLGDEIVFHTQFSPDGRWLAAFPLSDHLLLFADDGSPPRIIRGQPRTGAYGKLLFTPDGKGLLAHSPEEARVRMYGVPDGREIRQFEFRPPGRTFEWQPRENAVSPLGWKTLPQGALLWWEPEKSPPSARFPFGVWPYDGGPPTLLGTWPQEWCNFDPAGSRLLLLRKGRLVLRPLVAGDVDAAEQPIGALGEASTQGWNCGFDTRGEQAYAYKLSAEIGRMLIWSLRPGASAEPRVLSWRSPAVLGHVRPGWDPTGARVAATSTTEKAAWVWDLAGPPDAAPAVLRRPDAGSTKQTLFSPRAPWLVVTQASSLAFWAMTQPQARVLAERAGDINRLLFTSDSQSLLSSSRADLVRLWPLAPRAGAAGMRASRVPTDCLGAALAPDGQRLVCVGWGGVWLTSSFDDRGRWLVDDARFSAFSEAVAWDRSGRRVAAGGMYTLRPNSLMVFDLEAGTDRTLSLVPTGETGQGWEWGVQNLAFTPEGRLLAGGSGGVRWIDPETGAFDWVWRLPKEKSAGFALSADGRRLVAASRATGATGDDARSSWEVVLVDLGRGERRSIRSHGGGVTTVGLDAAGRTLVTGDEQGVVRVGLADGGEPHRLCCHTGKVSTVAVSPDGSWIGSASGGEIRLWPMPDVTKPPLHTLPYDELMAKLLALTNLQVVEDRSSPTGWKLDVGPFPGWKDVPTW